MTTTPHPYSTDDGIDCSACSYTIDDLIDHLNEDICTNCTAPYPGNGNDSNGEVCDRCVIRDVCGIMSGCEALADDPTAIDGIIEAAKLLATHTDRVMNLDDAIVKVTDITK